MMIDKFDITADSLKRFNINLNPVDSEEMKQIITTPSNWVHSQALYTQFKYKILKVSNNEFYLVGKGKKAGNNNAFFGSGFFGTVIGAVKITLEDEHLTIHKDKAYLVKRLQSDGTQEASIFKAEYGDCSCVTLQLDNKVKSYIIMPQIAGTQISKLIYNNKNQELAKNLIIMTFQKILKFHLKGYSHNDIKGDNVLYNPDLNQLNLIDFGNAHEFSKDEKRDEKGYRIKDYQVWADYDGLIGIIKDILFRYVWHNLIPDSDKGRDTLYRLHCDEKISDLSKLFLKNFKHFIQMGFCGELTQAKIDNLISEFKEELSKVDFDPHILELNKIIRSNTHKKLPMQMPKIKYKHIYDELVKSLHIQLMHYENTVQSRLFQRQSPDRKLIVELINAKLKQLSSDDSKDKNIKLMELIGFLKECMDRTQSSHTQGFFGFVGKIFTKSLLHGNIKNALMTVPESLLAWVKPDKKQVDSFKELYLVHLQDNLSQYNTL
jgi:serine/threonine protein kinase